MYLDVAGETVLASNVGGIFGSGNRIGELKIGGEGTVVDGWIEFTGVLTKISSTRCFKFHYGKYYNFADICLD